MDRAAFLARYGHIFEHSPWIAARAFDEPGETLHDRFMAVVHRASTDEQLALIRAHPELAARVALTDASAAEQQGAGLRALSETEFATFSRLNAAYREKFGFPFIICVGENTKNSILAAFESRLGNDATSELATALCEIGKIAKLRLDALP